MAAKSKGGKSTKSVKDLQPRGRTSKSVKGGVVPVPTNPLDRLKHRPKPKGLI